MYAKFIDEHHVEFLYPPVLHAEGKILANPTEAEFFAAGYLPVIEEAPPRVDFPAKILLSYRNEENAIRTVYTVEEVV